MFLSLLLKSSSTAPLSHTKYTVYKGLFFVIVLTVSVPVFAQDYLSSWRLVRQDNNVWVWKLAGTREVIGTFQTKIRAKSIDWTKIKSKSFFLNLKREKQKMLSMIGITNWVVRNSQWRRKKDHYELTLIGSYKNAQNKRISFREVHLFYKRKTHQILLSYPSKTPIKRSIASQFVSKAKRMAL